jgi:dTDP-4-amino-4,6-dideoxygalactose transaminase
MREELALHGGQKTASEPFPPWPQFSERTLAEALEPLRTGRVASWSGTKCAEFEEHWAAWAGASHAVACSSGTAALHMALLALGVQPGDEVLVPSHTFLSTSLAVLHAGARPVFCDVTDDQTLDPGCLEEHVTAKTRAVIVVHLYGIVCDMDRIVSAARRRGLLVIEDCAQCAGGELNGKKAGTLGDAGCFSFSQGKHVSTAGEGGMVVTAAPEAARACRSLRDYGREQEGTGPAAHVRVGYNYRLTEIQAVVGLHELARLDSWNLLRRAGFA